MVCKFCNAPLVLRVAAVTAPFVPGFSGPIGYKACCAHCGAEGPVRASEQDAVGIAELALQRRVGVKEQP